ncbi:hypothetical protein D3C85_1129810 [compost metagenome]
MLAVFIMITIENTLLNLLVVMMDLTISLVAKDGDSFHPYQQDGQFLKKVSSKK